MISYQHPPRTQAGNYQCQTNGHNHQLIHLEQVHDYSLAVISTESLYQLMYFKFIGYKFNRRNFNSYFVIYIT